MVKATKHCASGVGVPPTPGRRRARADGATVVGEHAERDESGGEAEVEVHGLAALLGAAPELAVSFIHEWVRSITQRLPAWIGAGAPLRAISAVNPSWATTTRNLVLS